MRSSRSPVRADRLAALAAGLALLPGCGGEKSPTGTLPAASSAKRVHVSLPWRNGAPIPRKYTCDGADVRPVVRVTPAAREMAIVMTDPDAPGGTFVHWTRWDGVEGQNSFGKTGYGGPCPPKGDKPHRYVVTVYVLKRPLGLGGGAPADKVLSAIGPLAVARGSAIGTYGR